MALKESKILLILLTFSIGLTSCYSYRQQKSRFKDSVETYYRDTLVNTVFVINAAEFREEYILLKKSGLYKITDDSTTNFKLLLLPLQTKMHVMCMTGPVAVMIVTLGQMPVRVPETHSFEYPLIENNSQTQMCYDITIDYRMWFWDIFSFKKNKNKALGRALKNNLLN